MLNEFFQSIGKVSGKGEKNNVKYTWVVVDPQIDLEPGTAKFEAKVQLKAGAFETTEKAHGAVMIDYIRETNRIKVQVQEAKVKLYLKIFGKDIPIARLTLQNITDRLSSSPDRNQSRTRSISKCPTVPYVKL
jgi:hypothetical protein